MRSLGNFLSPVKGVDIQKEKKKCAHVYIREHMVPWRQLAA